MFHFLLKYPIINILGLCLLLFLTAGIFFNGDIFDENEIHYIILSILFCLCGNSSLKKIQIGFTALLFLIVYLFFDHPILLFFGEILQILLFTWQRRFDKNIFTFMIIATSFLAHLYYIQNIGADYHQHDLIGVLYYMKAITLNGINFWDFDPWYMYYLFHQPLHFIIFGYMRAFALYLWNSDTLSVDLLQYLSLFYVSATIIFVFRIFKLVNIKHPYSDIALFLFSFNGSLFLFSGYIFDDTPVLFWITSFVYFCLSWFKTDQRRYIVFAAICFGLGVLTKLSILTFVPAVFILFLYKLYKANNRLKILEDLSIFTIIAVPLSLIWIFRNHILFDMPFYNIPDTSPNGQNFNYLTFWERIGDFSSLFSPFLNAPYVVEKNMWLAIIKTELFGEWDLSLHNAHILYPAIFAYFFNILIKLFAIFSCFYILLKRECKSFTILDIFFVFIYVFIWIYCFKYAMDYPYACSTDYRLFSGIMIAENIINFRVIQQFKVKPIYLISIIFVYNICISFIYLTGI